MASLTFKLGGHLWELDLPVWTCVQCGCGPDQLQLVLTVGWTFENIFSCIVGFGPSDRFHVGRR